MGKEQPQSDPGRTAERDQREHRERHKVVTSASAVTSRTVSTPHTTIGRT
ncbi:hypothetical protein [Nostocoides vanveenii]